MSIDKNFGTINTSRNILKTVNFDTYLFIKIFITEMIGKI